MNSLRDMVGVRSLAFQHILRMHLQKLSVGWVPRTLTVNRRLGLVIEFVVFNYKTALNGVNTVLGRVRITCLNTLYIMRFASWCNSTRPSRLFEQIILLNMLYTVRWVPSHIPGNETADSLTRQGSDLFPTVNPEKNKTQIFGFGIRSQMWFSRFI